MTTEKNQELGDPNADIHVMPDDGKHDCAEACFCWPELHHVDPYTGKRVWVHRETRKEFLS